MTPADLPTTGPQRQLQLSTRSVQWPEYRRYPGQPDAAAHYDKHHHDAVCVGLFLAQAKRDGWDIEDINGLEQALRTARNVGD